MNQLIMLTKGSNKNKIDRRDRFNWSAINVICLSIELWSLIFIVADQLQFYKLFYKTCRLPEQCLCPFVDTYKVPGPSNEFLLLGTRFSLISLALLST